MTEHFVIDVNNIVHRLQPGLPRQARTLEPFFSVQKALLDAFPGAEVLGFADHSIRFVISKESEPELDRLVHSRVVATSAPGDEADIHLLKYAASTGAVIVSQDRYKKQEYRLYHERVRQLRPSALRGVVTFGEIRTIAEWLASDARPRAAQGPRPGSAQGGGAAEDPQRPRRRPVGADAPLAVGLGIDGIVHYHPPDGDGFFHSRTDLLLETGAAPDAPGWFPEPVEVHDGVSGTFKLLLVRGGVREVHDTGLRLRDVFGSPGSHRVALCIRQDGWLDVLLAPWDAPADVRAVRVGRMTRGRDALEPVRRG